MTITHARSDEVIYLDHQATTPVDPRVLDAMLPYLTSAYGNPASPHALGRQAASAVQTARRQLRDLIGASSDTEIIFTSGATESDYLAIVVTPSLPMFLPPSAWTTRPLAPASGSGWGEAPRRTVSLSLPSR
ncbi:MAG: aminotransferase class V-fold PLP-dependent enzyme [Trebonia sp.]